MKVLIVVDAQEGFKNKYTETVLGKIEKLVETEEYYVIATKFCNNSESSFFNIMDWREMCSDEEQELVEVIRFYANRVIRKNTYGLYKGQLQTEVDRGLEEDVERVVYLCGVDTDACVMTMAMELFDLGIKPIILSNYCASTGGKDLHDMAMKILRRSLGDKCISDMI
jgi:nicotinamidase-related amidase